MFDSCSLWIQTQILLLLLLQQQGMWLTREETIIVSINITQQWDCY